jgi:beta-phosphoglucomutase-like phosphatase (HAD superfamily)
VSETGGSTIRAVLFDIDGTLLVTGGAGAVAWQRAFEELHGVEADIAEHTDAGMTDPEIAAIVFREVIGREGTQEERSKAIGCYLKHLPTLSLSPRVTASCPGSRSSCPA